MKDFFDRKTFDPLNNEQDRKTLNTLRAFGSGRRYESMAMRFVTRELRKDSVFVDLGCGESRDWMYARERSAIFHRIDLFPPQNFHNRTWNHDATAFMQADVAERIPLEDNSVDAAIAQAMLDLIEPVARQQFFCEVDRILKPGGIFACQIQWLQPGWGIDFNEEVERAREVWSNVQTKGQVFVARKEKTNE